MVTDSRAAVQQHRTDTSGHTQKCLEPGSHLDRLSLPTETRRSSAHRTRGRPFKRAARLVGNVRNPSSAPDVSCRFLKSGKYIENMCGVFRFGSLSWFCSWQTAMRADDVAILIRAKQWRINALTVTVFVLYLSGSDNRKTSPDVCLYHSFLYYSHSTIISWRWRLERAGSITTTPLAAHRLERGNITALQHRPTRPSRRV